MKRFKITWFCNASQKIEIREFKGKNAFQNAIKWGRKTLTNFSVEMIQMIY